MKNRIKLLGAVLAAMVLLVCLAGCGENGSDEETLKITTVAEEETTQKADEDMSVYEEIYREYDEKLASATKKYSKEIKKKADSMSQDDLYDFVTEEIDKLDKIREEGAEKMTDQTLGSTDDDQDEYEKWFSKLSEQYSEYTRKLTAIYTERF